MVRRRATGRHCFFFLSLTVYLQLWPEQCEVPPNRKIMSTLRLSTQHEDAHLLLLCTTYRCSHHSIQYISGRLCNTVEKPTLVSKLEKKKKLTTDTWLCDARLDAIVFCFSLSYSLLTFLSTTVRSSPQSKIMSWLQLSTQQEDAHFLLLRTTYRCSRLSI